MHGILGLQEGAVPDGIGVGGPLLGEVIAIGQIPQGISAVLHGLFRDWLAAVEIQFTHDIVPGIQKIERILPWNLRHCFGVVVQSGTCMPSAVATGHIPAETHGCALIIHQHPFQGHIQGPDNHSALTVLLSIQAGFGYDGSLTIADTGDNAMLVHLGNAGILGGVLQALVG